MSKTETKSTETKSVRFYKKAMFPWLIMAFVATLGVGVVTGWTLRSDFEARLESRVSAQVEKSIATIELKENEK